MTSPVFQRESVEFQPVTITENGVGVTTGVQFAVVPHSTRPVTWAAPSAVGAQIGVMVSGYAPGDWDVFAQVTANPETPVLFCGTFRVL